jgi:branched-chain amino acid transport system ATP-binding protein
MTSLLSVQGVSKQFGGLRALTQVTFNLPQGQILGLIGPNGAGKTTLFNVITGVHHPESGRIFFQDRDVTGMKSYQLARLGMARTHQIVCPLNELTVLENVMVGACFGRENNALGQASRIAEEVLTFTGLGGRAGQLAGSLNVAQKKLLETARALASHPYLLFLDEVLAGLNPSEVEGMMQIIRKIRQQGITIIMIEHLMKAVMNVSDRLLVLDHGEQIGDGTPEEISRDPRVIEAYLGDANLAKKLLAEAA